MYVFSNYYFTIFEHASNVDDGGGGGGDNERLTSAGQVRTLLFPTRGPPSTLSNTRKNTHELSLFYSPFTYYSDMR